MKIFTVFNLVGAFKKVHSHIFVMYHLRKANTKQVKTVKFLLDPDTDVLMVRYDDKCVYIKKNCGTLLQIFDFVTRKEMRCSQGWDLQMLKHTGRYSQASELVTSTFDVISISPNFSLSGN